MQSPDRPADQIHRPRRALPPMLRVAGLVAFIGLLPLAFIAVSTYLTVLTVAAQYEAQAFTPVDATIISTQSISRVTGQGTEYEIDIEYRYTFDGQTYTADTFRLGARSVSSFWVNEQLRAFPAGSQRVAYVDPDDPSRAVLDNSFTLLDMMIPAVLSVFYAVIAVGMIGAIHIVRYVRGDPPPLSGAQIFRDDTETIRIRPHHSPPSFRAANLGLLLLFGAVFLLFFVVIRFTDRFIMFPMMLGIIMAIVVVYWAFVVWPWRRSAHEITIDRRQRMIIAPRSRDSRERSKIAFDDVAAITTQRSSNRDWAVIAQPGSAREDAAELVRFKRGKDGLVSSFAHDFTQLLGVPRAASQ